MARKRRKPRKGEVVCRCGAYPFPHRQFGGECQSAVLTETWDKQMFGRCRDCRAFVMTEEGPQCQVLEGLETWFEAECIQEHVAFHGIKLYGVNKPPRKRLAGRRG